MTTLLLLACVGAVQDEAAVRELVRKLGSETLVERGEAAQKLVEGGAPTLAILKRLPAPADGEVRSRVAAVIKEIEGRISREAAWPKVPTVSVDLQDVPLREAWKATIGRFGVRGLGRRPGDGLADEEAARRVTVRLKDAGFWQAVEGLAAAAGWKIGCVDNILHIRGDATPANFVEVGGARLYVGAVGDRTGGRVFVSLSPPPQSRMTDAEAEDVTVRFADGGDVEVQPIVMPRSVYFAAYRSIPAIPVWNARTTAEVAGRKVVVEGELVLREVADFWLYEGELKDGWQGRVEQDPTRPAKAACLWVCDAAGKRVADLGVLRHAHDNPGPYEFQARLGRRDDREDAAVSAKWDRMSTQFAHPLFAEGQKLTVAVVTSESVRKQRFKLEVTLPAR